MELITNFRLFSQPSEHTTQPNGVAPGVKKEPNGEQVTFVSTLAHRAQSLSPQKQKQKSLENAGFVVSKNPEPSPSAYHHSPYDSGDNERSFRAVSTTIPQKRKSQSAEASDVNDSSDELSLPLISQNGVLDNGVDSTGPSLKALGKRPAISPKTPSPPPQLPPADSVSVVIPSPSAAQRQQMKPSLKPEFIGLCERYFPTGREEQVKAQRRAYPIATAAKVNKKVVPFTIAKPTLKEHEPKPAASLSLAKSFPSQGSASNRAIEPETKASTAKLLRKKLRKKLKRICGGPETLFDVSDEQLATLSANFFFVGDYRLGPGVTPIDDDFLTGCDCGTVCDPSTCRCLIEEEDSDELIVAYERLESGMVVVRKEFLDRKAMISECSSRCLCAGSDCWNHVVQRGRQVRLEVFDTGERGLGLRCLEPLIVGQFIDCYFGEVITKKDADARESANEGKPSYLFNLDWLLGNGHHTYEESYVVDGQKFGTPTRYINHSCNPNCKIIPVSTNRLSDQRLYYLAFFAIRDIPANTELTFDYHPKWDQEKQIDPHAVKCLCGEQNCRGQLWPNIRKKGIQED
ncbi:uncharacterized protein N7496_011317 [Penicillium cataractarum]|uniref:SET domain-containing protein n=1 Tax=Penicillium cataractarum TaxID=2100454 RepID=A0A9W9RGL5_9EURO|nr:uncharacterized protein N7496_011317 [Penicillium cataractarum]KAJ5358904.1 hypothetical protein N7496_011317 [Penicillium cataractarum]